MKSKSILIATLVVAVTGMVTPAFATHAAKGEASQLINLKDGSTLYVFVDGKMAKADKYNRPVNINDNEVFEGKDGRPVTAVGNEVARLKMLFRRGHKG